MDKVIEESNNISIANENIDYQKLYHETLKRARIAEEEARKAKVEAKEYRLKMGIGYFFSDNAKLLDITFVGSKSGASKSSWHQEATAIEGEFKHINYELSEKELLGSSIVLASQSTTLNYSTKNDIRVACLLFVKDMINACSLSNDIYITSELSIYSCKSDRWVFMHDNYPVGTFEVKKNNLDGSSIMESKVLFGQIFDYMMKIRSVNGIRYVFGVITDYRE